MPEKWLKKPVDANTCWFCRFRGLVLLYPTSFRKWRKKRHSMCGSAAWISSKNGHLAAILKKKVDLKINAHFEDIFQIYPSMLEKITAELTILTLVQTLWRVHTRFVVILQKFFAVLTRFFCWCPYSSITQTFWIFKISRTLFLGCFSSTFSSSYYAFARIYFLLRNVSQSGLVMGHSGPFVVSGACHLWHF